MRNKIIATVIVIIVLAFAFLWGGNAPSLRGWNISGPSGVPQTQAPDLPSDIPPALRKQINSANENSVQESSSSSAQESSSEDITNIPVKSADEPATADNKPSKADNTPLTPEEKIALAEAYAQNTSNPDISSDSSEQSNTSHTDDDIPQPVNPQDAVISDKEMTCTLSVRCDTILNNIAWLDPDKVELIPKDGVILSEQSVTFYEGESVFNLLLREMKRNKIHMEFVNTPIYNSAYIEGINNIYEFDCGELSGWMYKVNDRFPNYGCSSYQLKEGDRVEWIYTCDLGVDIGGYSSSAGQRK